MLTAAQWVQGTLLGTIATAVAIIAVAATGMLMLSGRIDVRRGVSVVMGCFILFGASGIAEGVRTVVAGDTQTYVVPVVQEPMPVRARPPDIRPYDPYAGASVPTE